MLTPVDIQHKKFHMGIGYEKKDVTTFFGEVSNNYEELYRANADLTERVSILTDELQNYKSKEEEVKRSLMLAEKDSEDTKSRANREAKTIELDAKNKAKNILADAEKQHNSLKNEIKLLTTQYANYKSNFAALLKAQFTQLEEEDFDVEAYIDENFVSLIGGAPANGSAFGSYDGDPQMRDESALGGLGSGGGDVTSTSAVYTASLSVNDSFVDPFSPNKKQSGRYNPYDDMGKTSASEEKTTTKFKVSNKNEKKTPKRVPTNPASTGQEATNSATSTLNSATTATTSSATGTASSAASQGATNKAAEDVNVTAKANEPIPTVPTMDTDNDNENEQLEGTVEISAGGKALLGDAPDSEDTDEDGFEFVE